MTSRSMLVEETFRAAGIVRRRSVTDRRQRQLQAFLCQFVKARRVRERRINHDGARQYVDVHGPGLLLIVLAILMMCVADAYLTLTLLNDGAVELNPVMRPLVEGDWGTFFYVKYGVTACSLLILLMHKNFRLFGSLTGQHVLLSVLLGYALVIAYEVTLLVRSELFLLG